MRLSLFLTRWSPKLVEACGPWIQNRQMHLDYNTAVWLQLRVLCFKYKNGIDLQYFLMIGSFCAWSAQPLNAWLLFLTERTIPKQATKSESSISLGRPKSTFAQPILLMLHLGDPPETVLALPPLARLGKSYFLSKSPACWNNNHLAPFFATSIYPSLPESRSWSL